MKLSINTAACSGHAQCAATAPDLFEVDDLGYALPFDGDVPSGQEDAAQAGAASCPERAITITD